MKDASCHTAISGNSEDIEVPPGSNHSYAVSAISVVPKSDIIRYFRYLAELTEL